ncbi:MAG: hypothetical protein OFPII_36440 [Osedax symbiont Rs1]|nr:MAG: hypothetical protein OFPII_36440 [Osedax symbiont Rs1]
MFLALIEFVALVSVGLVAGSTFYISCVEIPARKLEDHHSQLSSWKQIFPPAGKLLRAFGTATIPFLILVGFFSGSWLWFLAAGLMIVLMPFTLMKIAPVNEKLLALSLDQADENTSKLIRDWDALHHVRTLLAIGAFLIAALASILPIT